MIGGTVPEEPPASYISVPSARTPPYEKTTWPNTSVFTLERSPSLALTVPTVLPLKITWDSTFGRTLEKNRLLAPTAHIEPPSTIIWKLTSVPILERSHLPALSVRIVRLRSQHYSRMSLPIGLSVMDLTFMMVYVQQLLLIIQGVLLSCRQALMCDGRENINYLFFFFFNPDIYSYLLMHMQRMYWIRYILTVGARICLTDSEPK